MKFTNREKELIDHALSYMFSNLDDINECIDVCNMGDFKPYTEKEVEKLREKFVDKVKEQCIIQCRLACNCLTYTY